MEETAEIFIKTLQLLYQPDTEQECKENAKELLETLHEGTDQKSSSELRDFVYRVIKAFAKENNDSYQDSNLIELMNHVVECRRGEIFEAEQLSSTISSSRAKPESKNSSVLIKNFK